MRGVADRQDGEDAQPFQRTMIRSSAGRLDLNQEIGFALFLRLGVAVQCRPMRRYGRLFTNWTQASSFRTRRPSRTLPALNA
jgi:hypothetical protein